MTYLFRIMILALLLTGCSVLIGCSAFEQKIGSYKQDPSCCTTDTEFPHSCDGWILCDKPLIIEETEL